ncbi:MAG: hypothetical protein ACRDNB_03670 [Gaiellaceae bacterium]
MVLVRVLASLVVALVVAPPATAKGPMTLRVCGDDGCASERVNWVWHGTEFEGIAQRPAAPAGYYRVSLLATSTPVWEGYYEPGSRLIAGRDPSGWVYWARVTRKLEVRVDNLAKQVTPFPVPSLAAARVGARWITENPSTYLRLFTVEGARAIPRSFADVRRVHFDATRANPWSDSLVLYYPSDDILQIGGSRLIRVPPDVAAAVEDAQPIGGAATGSRFTPFALIGILGAAAVALAIAFRLRARQAHARAQPT